ncbi:hypothetical protein, partial [Vibrio sp. 03_296]|uniref:SMODS domain-containing nucleotidyltransferase n=1 Tax=Vibrio sp. 03_296 TaxID=2024409 RepID=UPI002D7EECD6
MKIQEQEQNFESLLKASRSNLNETVRGLENDKTSYSLQAGSYGRYSGIQGISDLDMLYIL